MEDFPASELPIAAKQAIRDKASWMSLDYVAVSPEAKGLVEKLRVRLETAPERPTSQRKSEDAMAAILAELIAALRDGVWTKRPLATTSFTGQRVGYRHFVAAIEKLEGANLIERLAGYTDRTGFGPRGRPTCFRLSPSGVQMVKEAGINPKTSFAAHFRKTEVDKGRQGE